MQEFDDELFRTDTAALKRFNEQVITEFRSRAGKVGGRFEGRQVLLLTTTGSKTGTQRVTPLAYFVIDGQMVVIGSRGGAPTDPAWVTNLRANPRASVEAGTDAGIESFSVTAHEVHYVDRDRIYAEVATLSAVFAIYQSRTSRVIPVFVLRRDAD